MRREQTQEEMQKVMRGTVRDVIAENDGRGVRGMLLRLGATEEQADTAAELVAKDGVKQRHQKPNVSIS